MWKNLQDLKSDLKSSSNLLTHLKAITELKIKAVGLKL